MSVWHGYLNWIGCWLGLLCTYFLDLWPIAGRPSPGIWVPLGCLWPGLTVVGFKKVLDLGMCLNCALGHDKIHRTYRRSLGLCVAIEGWRWLGLVKPMPTIVICITWECWGHVHFLIVLLGLWGCTGFVTMTCTMWRNECMTGHWVHTPHKVLDSHLWHKWLSCS